MRILMATAILSLLAGCGSSSGWQVSDEVDAMSDLRTLTAVHAVSGDFAKYEVVVRCIPKRLSLAYIISAFDDEGRGVALSRSIGASEFRPDGAPARFLPSAGLNSVAAYSSTREAAGANRIVIRVGTNAGADTFEIDQSNAEYRSVAEPCLQALAESERKRKEAEAAMLAAAPVEPVTAEDDGMNDADGERPIRMDEIQEIEAHTGLPYEEGDSIYTNAEAD